MPDHEYSKKVNGIEAQPDMAGKTEPSAEVPKASPEEEGMDVDAEDATSTEINNGQQNAIVNGAVA